jgi:transcription antitermination factor NusG
VPERQMDNFIRVASVQDDRLLYLDPNNEFLQKPGHRVRITDGDFKDAEGVIKRIKNNKRIVVEIKGVAAIAITFVPAIWLEPIEE